MHLDILGKNEVIAHMIRLHKHDPQFVILCAVCGQSYAKYESCRKHVQRGHKNIAIENNEINAVAIGKESGFLNKVISMTSGEINYRSPI